MTNRLLIMDTTGSLNCTFMELKFHNVTFNLKAGIVLIVPLWN